jgi:LmbE family N-acetylglucosaminyl deacetylase
VYYLCIHLRQVVQPAFVVDISPYWPQKKAAVECYHSQFFEGRPADQITITERLEHEAGYWGWMIGARYGEAFATRDPLGLQSFDGVL